MNVAETASTFAELIVADATLKAAKTKEEKINLLDTKLQNALAMFMNIHSRFIFENHFYTARQAGLVSEDEITAIKNVTINEPFFNGHFPQYPVMPGVLIMEALAQTAGVLELSKPENKGKLVFYAGMDKVKFKKQVVPGDQLVMTAKFVKRRGTIAVVEAKAEVDGKLAASGTLTFAIGS